MLVDSHAHLDSVEDLGTVLGHARSEGISEIITAGTSIESSRKCVEIAEQRRIGTRIYATIGIHPQDGENEIKNLGLYQCINSLIQITKTSDRVIGIGETGLDYYETGDTKQVTSKDDKKNQRELFREQVKLAVQLKLPLVIHCRNAWEETFSLLTRHNHYSSSGAKRNREVPIKKFSTSLSTMSSRPNGSNNKLTGVFHSWTGDWNAARKALDLGFYISFSGIVTFKNAQEIQEVAQKVPLDRILLETDSPYLSPEPLRGKTNEPKNVKIVAQFVADLRHLSFEEIAGITSENAGRLFVI